MAEVVSFHLATFPTRSLASRLVTVPAERWELATAEGCVLGKVMGTSKEGTTRISADLTRWAILAVWRDGVSRERFIESSTVLQRWRRTAITLQHYLLEPTSSKGSWGGIELQPNVQTSPSHGGQVAVVTRASISWRRWLRFARSIGRVDDSLRAAGGCSLALGIGEWPVGEQATFSLWRSAEDVDAFAYRDGAHADVMRSAFRERWFGESLFARFAVTEVVNEK